MKILLDACIPQDLRHKLSDHDVQTARFAELHELTDSDLLDAMEGQFDVLVTTDTNLQYQQNLKERPFAVLVLRAKTNRLPDLVELMPELLGAIGRLKPGQVREIKTN
ncbi:MAG: DUF5615 family PIN-like protein [Hyphomicrobiaceae bacterium]|nr:DUF5615 family PIN-like protein [Hyphomicrobiaceae bacterium]